ncbi:MAG: phenolic acid decarboxylase subunit B, partial [Alicyclobacillus macrosporangiidus]|nr:phenolic acid decarboxylase subunit B [Alicyclobacillus macrosporangiidus]
LENMLRLAELGVSIVPPMPAFYTRPASVDDLVDHTVARVLDQFGIQTQLTKRWKVEEAPE